MVPLGLTSRPARPRSAIVWTWAIRSNAPACDTCQEPAMHRGPVRKPSRHVALRAARPEHVKHAVEQRAASASGADAPHGRSGQRRATTAHSASLRVVIEGRLSRASAARAASTSRFPGERQSLSQRPPCSPSTVKLICHAHSEMGSEPVGLVRAQRGRAAVQRCHTGLKTTKPIDSVEPHVEPLNTSTT